MLKRFEVEGFRNFDKRFVLDLADVRDYRFNSSAIEGDVIKCGIIYGRNAVGKTNLSNALFDISVNAGHSILLRDESNYLSASQGCVEASFSYSFSFESGDVEYSYTKASRRLLKKERLFVDGVLAFEYDHSQDELLDGDLSIIGADKLNWWFRTS